MALPANLFKWTLFMEGSKQGYTETWYFARPSPDLQSAIAAVQSLFDTRASLLGKEYSLIGSRVARITDPAAVKVRRFAQLQNLNLQGAPTKEGAEPATAGLVTATHAPTGRKKQWFMAGVWEDEFPGGGRFEPVGVWNSRWQAYQAQLRGLNVGWIGQVEGAKVNATGYVLDPVTGRVTITLSADPGMPTDGKPFEMRFSFPVPGLPLNGQHLVLKLTNTSVITRNGTGVQPFLLEGKAWVNEPNFFTVTEVDTAGRPGEIRAVKAVDRKRGKVSIATRGRRPLIRQW